MGMVCSICAGDIYGKLGINGRPGISASLHSPSPPISAQFAQSNTTVTARRSMRKADLPPEGVTLAALASSSSLSFAQAARISKAAFSVLQRVEIPNTQWALNPMASLVTSASNAISFGPPSPAPENWLVAARIPPEYAPNFSGKNSGGNGSFKRRNG